MQELISQLNAKIKTEEENLQTMKEQLSKLKKQEKEQRHFSQTTIGSAYLKTIRAISAPFVSMNERAVMMSEHPELVKEKDLVQEGTKLLKKAEKMSDDHKRAHKMAIKCAKLIIELEEFYIQNKQIETQEALLENLDQQIQRLRAPVDEKKRAEVQGMIKEFTQTVEVSHS